MKKRIFSLLLLIFVVFGFAGCYSSVTVTEYPNGENPSVFRIQLNIDNSEISKLDGSAITSNGTRYSGHISFDEFKKEKDTAFTIDEYIQVLGLLSQSRDDMLFIKKEQIVAGYNNSATAYLFELTQDEWEYNDISTVVKTKPELYKKGFYFYHYRYTGKSPFTNLRKRYDNSITNKDYSSIFGIINNGWREFTTIEKKDGWELEHAVKKSEGFKDSSENDNVVTMYRELLPSMADAFPAFKQETFDASGLRFNYLIRTDRKFTVTSGEKYIDSDKHKYYLFKSRFVDEDDTVTYEIIRANTIGWNITAILAGGLVVLGIFLFVKFYKKKKPKAKAQDYFPYDPSSVE